MIFVFLKYYIYEITSKIKLVIDFAPLDLLLCINFIQNNIFDS